MKINKYYYIHIHNWQKGWSIGDLFNSLLFLLSEKRTNEKIILLTHESFVPFVKCIFPDLIDEFVFNDNNNNFVSIHKDFVKLASIINAPLNLKINHRLLLNNNDKLLPNNSILLILNRSDQYLLNIDVTNIILKTCSNKNVYIRNVIDNHTYQKSYVKYNYCQSYEEDLMCLIESCMKRQIKIIMNRCGLVDALGYITQIPIFILYTQTPNWIKNFNFSVHIGNKYLNEKMNPNITEYFINNNNIDLEQKLNIFLNNNSD